MEIIDMNKLEIAIKYIERITEGKNPVNNAMAEDDAVLNNPNVIRCMFFVKEVLECVKRNDGYVGGKSKSKKKEFPYEILSDYEYVSDKPLSKLMNQLNEMRDDRLYKKLTYSPVMAWLNAGGYMREIYVEKYKKDMKVPTKKGMELGIYMKEYVSEDGREYSYAIYNQNAQQFIVEHLEDIFKSDDE